MIVLAAGAHSLARLMRTDRVQPPAPRADQRPLPAFQHPTGNDGLRTFQSG